MQRSLADLKSLEPEYTEDTPKYSIHFSKTNSKEIAKYSAFLKSEGKNRIDIIDNWWAAILPIEVKLNK